MKKNVLFVTFITHIKITLSGIPRSSPKLISLLFNIDEEGGVFKTTNASQSVFL